MAMNNTTSNEDLLHILETSGLSKTPQRIAVLKILKNSVVPVNLKNIRQTLRSGIKIDRVTVYRILSLFKQRMIIREISSRTGASYFELATTENPAHPHFTCRNCEKLFCLEPFSLPQASHLNKKYVIEQIDVNISGLCADCCSSGIPRRKGDKKCL